MLNLLREQITDPATRENYKRIQSEFDTNPVLLGQLSFRTYTFTQAETAKKLPHGLKFIPQDVIITSQIGAGVATVNYALIDATNLSITTTGACVVRLLLGKLG